MDTKINNSNPLKKFWIIHNFEEGITSIVRFIDKMRDGNYMIAVARAFKSVDDNMFSRPAGRNNAMMRMEKFFTRRYNKASRHKRRPFEIIGHIRKDKNNRKHSEVTFFEIGDETALNFHEMEVWHNKILPRIEEELNNLA